MIFGKKNPEVKRDPGPRRRPALRLPWRDIEDPREQVAHARDLFREVFGTDRGKIVLAVIFDELKYNKATTTEGETALRNYATYLLAERIGIRDHLAVVDAIMSIQTKET